MRPFFWIVVCLSVALGGLHLLPPAMPAPGGPTRFALVVGVNEYDYDGLKLLKYAANDATALRDVLEKGGYQVVLLTEAEAKGKKDERLRPTKANIETHLKRLAEEFPKGGTLLVALSGHGVQFGGDDDSFFCPVDARPFKERKNTLVSVKGIYDRLSRDAAAGAKLVLVDACRNDPDPDKGSKGGIAADTAPSPPRGVGVLLSCSAAERSWEADAYKHGVFFYHVLAALRGDAPAKDEDGNVTWDSLRSYVKKRVAKDVPKLIRDDLTQSPEESGRLAGIPPVLIPGRIRPKALSGATTSASVKAAQKAWAEYLGVPVEKQVKLAEGIVLELVLIPPGTFWMGSPKGQKDRDKDEGQHEVEITRAYYLGKYELTQQQYESILGTGKNPSHIKGAKLPVESVSWEEANAYTKKLTEKLGGRLVFRLPTEAEWEYACRGGAVLEASLPYHLEVGPTDSLPTSAANYDESKINSMKPVGSYRPNRFGLYDMHGNVWEWCSDWYGEYPTRKVIDPTGPSEGSQRVFRGGSWRDRGAYCAASNRARGGPAYRDHDLGFRLLAVPSAGK